MVKRIPLIILTVLMSMSVSSWADEVQDPYEKYNRAIFKFNDKADKYVMTPVTRGYRKITPKPVRNAIGNFFNNLRDVGSFGSNLLRGHFSKAGNDFMRVAVNSTFGLGGLIDIADAAGMPNNKNTFGDTLASWGWKNSNYLVLPLMGPSTVRDGVGAAIHTIYSPVRAINDTPARYSIAGVGMVNTREQLLDVTDTLDEMALDKYVVTRNTYMNYRKKQIGILSSEEDESGLIDPETLIDPASGTHTNETDSHSAPTSLKE